MKDYNLKNKEQIEWPSIGGSIKEIGDDFSKSIPHISIGNDGFHTQNSKKVKHLPILTKKTPLDAPNDEKTLPLKHNSEELLNNLKKWGLFISITLLSGYVGYRIIQSILT